jgi:hypothetical protein
MGRTVDAAPAAETLPAGHYHGAATECRAWLGNMKARGARARHEVSKAVQGLGMRGVVVCCGTRLE